MAQTKAWWGNEETVSISSKFVIIMHMTQDKKQNIQDYVFYLYEVKRKRFHPVRNGFTIGRSASDLTYDDDKLLSRSHAEFIIEGENASIKDLDTTNGIKVNGDKVQEAELNHNDYIRAGHQKFIFSITNNVNDLELERTVGDKTKVELQLPDKKEKVQVLFRGEKQKLISLFRKNLRTPLDFKNRSKIFYIVLLLWLMAKIGLVISGESGLFYSKLNQVITNLVDVIVSYYITSVFFFTFKDIFDQNNWLVFEPIRKLRILLLILCAPIFYGLIGVFVADFSGTTRIEKTNHLDLVCRVKIDIYSCLKGFKGIFDDDLLMKGNHRVLIYEGLSRGIKNSLKKDYDATDADIKSLGILQIDFKDAVVSNQKIKIYKNFKIVKKYYIKLRNRVRDMRNSLTCVAPLIKKVYRDTANHDEYMVYCVDKKGIQQGISKKFDNRGRILSSSIVRDGKLNGVSTFYYSNGNKRMEVDYRDDQMYDEGFVIKWDRHGKETFNGINENQGVLFYKDQVKKVLKKCIFNDYEEKKKYRKCVNTSIENIWLKTHEIEFEKLRPEIILKSEKALAKLKKPNQKQDENDIICAEGSHLLERLIKGNLIEKACENKEGRKNGPYGVFFESGKPKILGNYINGLSAGIFKHYYPNGIVAIEGTIYNNKWVGFATVKDPEDKVTYAGDFPRDLPDIKKIVKNKIQDCDKRIKLQPSNDPPKLRMRKCMSPEVRLYSINKHPGIAQIFKKTVRFEIAKYSNRTKIGDIRCPKGTFLDKSEELFHRCINNENTYQGPYIIFYDNFVPKEVGLFENGKKNGPFRKYHKNGKLSQSSRYHNGEGIGVSTRWDEDGKLITKYNGNDKYQKDAIKFYKAGVNKCAGSKKEICIDKFINLYCNKSEEVECARLLEAKSYLNLVKMDQENQ